MLTNKEIRALPMPGVNRETRTLALQNADRKVYVITSRKIKSSVVINVYSKNEEGGVALFYRYFVNQYNALLYNVRANKITDGYLKNVFLPHDEITAAKKETEKLKRYISPDSSSRSVRNLIEAYDRQRSDRRSQFRKDQKCSEIDSIMRMVRKIPKSFENTIRKTMAHSSYIFYNRKENFGTCSCCGKTMKLSDLPGFKDKESGRCPECGKTIRFRSEARRQRFNTYDEGMAVLVQKYAYHVLIARYFHITYEYNDSPVPKVTVREVVRTLIDFDKHDVRDYEWYYYNEKMRWCLLQSSMFNPKGFHYFFLKGCIHRAGLANELDAADLSRYLQGWMQLNQYIKADTADSCYQHVKYLEYLADNPVFEPITKCGFYHLTADYMDRAKHRITSQINTEEHSVIKILRLKNRTQLQEARAININSDELKSIQTYNKTTDINRPVGEILRIAKEFDGREESAFALSDSRLRKLSKYLDRISSGEPGRRNLIVDYFDYLRNCESLGYVMTSEIVLYPKNFRQAHDRAAADVKHRKLNEECQKIAALLPDMHNRYDFSTENLFIKAPDSGKDILYEGQALNHCVGSYVPQVADGSTVILFIRRKNAPDKPYVTVEVRDDKIVQVRGFSNQIPNADVADFVEQFKKAKHIA